MKYKLPNGVKKLTDILLDPNVDNLIEKLTSLRNQKRIDCQVKSVIDGILERLQNQNLPN